MSLRPPYPCLAGRQAPQASRRSHFAPRMKQYELLPHTADIRVRISGDTPRELFAAGIVAMTHILRDKFCDTPKECLFHEKVRIHTVDRTALLIDFLSEILTMSYAYNALFCALEVHQLSGRHIEATVYGAPCDRFEEDIKAVTYHEADVRQRPDGFWETVIIFDI